MSVENICWSPPKKIYAGLFLRQEDENRSVFVRARFSRIRPPCPWVASSLLQKSSRCGVADLAEAPASPCIGSEDTEFGDVSPSSLSRTSACRGRRRCLDRNTRPYRKGLQRPGLALGRRGRRTCTTHRRPTIRERGVRRSPSAPLAAIRHSRMRGAGSKQCRSLSVSTC